MGALVPMDYGESPQKSGDRRSIPRLPRHVQESGKGVDAVGLEVIDPAERFSGFLQSAGGEGPGTGEAPATSGQVGLAQIARQCVGLLISAQGTVKGV